MRTLRFVCALQKMSVMGIAMMSAERRSEAAWYRVREIVDASKREKEEVACFLLLACRLRLALLVSLSRLSSNERSMNKDCSSCFLEIVFSRPQVFPRFSCLLLHLSSKITSLLLLPAPAHPSSTERSTWW